LHECADRIAIGDKRTITFRFKSPFLGFRRLMGTSSVCGAGWVGAATYFEKVGKDGFAG
jgi:hypothetical protein